MLMNGRAALAAALGIVALGTSGQSTRQLDERTFSLHGQQLEPVGLQRSVSRHVAKKALLFGGFGASGGNARRAGYGWTNRHAQRVALKARNKARHRAACKGAGA